VVFAEFGLEYGSFCPFLGDLGRGVVASRVVIPLDGCQVLCGRLFSFSVGEASAPALDTEDRDYLPRCRLDGLRIFAFGLKHGSFCPFLGDLGRGRWRGRIITLPNYIPAPESLKMPKITTLPKWQKKEWGKKKREKGYICIWATG
jgi:hypothetical protein